MGLVVNYDVPLDAKTYMHRVGRTARAGRRGCALTLVTQYSVVFYLKEIESRLRSALGDGNQQIPCLVAPHSPADNAVEAAVEALDFEVKAGTARANQVCVCGASIPCSALLLATWPVQSRCFCPLSPRQWRRCVSA